MYKSIERRSTKMSCFHPYLCHCPSLFWHYQILFPDLSDQRAPLPAIAEVLLVVEDEPDVVLAAHQDDRGVGTELLDLAVPHLAAVVKGTLATDVETHLQVGELGNVYCIVYTFLDLHNISELTRTTSDLPYANLLSLWWSPNVSQSLRETLTPSRSIIEFSNTWKNDSFLLIKREAKKQRWNGKEVFDPAVPISKFSRIYSLIGVKQYFQI